MTDLTLEQKKDIVSSLGYVLIGVDVIDKLKDLQLLEDNDKVVLGLAAILMAKKLGKMK